MDAHTEKTKLFSALKQILKQRKITYAELASRTNNSESTVKRIFSIEECSLSKLIQITSAVGISLAELTEFAEQQKVGITMFSKDAEEFLAHSIDYFFIYRKLFHHRNVKEVQSREGLSKNEITRYLKKLDELGVLKWLANDELGFSHSGFLKFRDDGPLQAAVYKAWIPKFNDYILENTPDNKSQLKAFSSMCTPDSKQWFLLEFEDLVERFIKRASLDKKTQVVDLVQFGVTLATGPLLIGLDESDLDLR